MILLCENNDWNWDDDVRGRGGDRVATSSCLNL